MNKAGFDEIIVAKVKNIYNEIGIKVVSIHKDYVNGLIGGEFITEHQLMCLNALGFAIVDARLGKDGKKVYYYHNRRTAGIN